MNSRHTKAALAIVILTATLAIAGAALARPAAGAPSANTSIYLPMLFKSFVPGTQVTIKQFAYTPKDITIAAGTHVVWTNAESTFINHTVTSGVPGVPTGVFESGTLSPGQAYGVTFTTPGTYAYYCRFHGLSMTGTVTVTP